MIRVSGSRRRRRTITERKRRSAKAIARKKDAEEGFFSLHVQEFFMEALVGKYGNFFPCAQRHGDGKLFREALIVKSCNDTFENTLLEMPLTL